MRYLAFRLAVASLVPAAACSSGGPGGPDGSATTLVSISGNTQTGAPNGVLAAELVVEARSATETPVSGAVVDFLVVTSGGGTVTPASATTNAQGRAQTSWTLGPTVGTIVARATLRGVAGATVDFTASAVSTARQLEIVSGNNQSGPIGSTLAPLVVRVVDGTGTPVVGVSVAFAAASGGGSVSPGSATTDAQGHAQTVWTMGSISGTQTVTGSAAGVGGSPLTFSATATALRAQLAAGISHTCGVTPAGAVYCWGSNAVGALGDGTTTNRLTPVPVAAPPGVTFVQVAAGRDHSCGLASTGTLFCWGYNNFGQQGDGTRTQRLTPVAVAGFTFAQVAAGTWHTCGAPYCWGVNDRGQLGNGSPTQSLTPVSVAAPAGVTFAQLAAGTWHTCGVSSVRSGGRAYCWGFNDRGQLGDGTTTQRLTPVAVASPAGVNFAQVAAGVSHTCGVTWAGVVYCWGSNAAGALGDGTTTNRLTPVPVAAPPGVTFTQVAAGLSHTCGVTPAGAVYCWGSNAGGALGDGTTTPRLTPVAVASPAGVTFTQVAAGHSYTCAAAVTGAAYCWGDNEFGQLGDGTAGFDRLTPVRAQTP